jgi:hypothetical protein
VFAAFHTTTFEDLKVRLLMAYSAAIDIDARKCFAAVSHVACG